MIKIRFPLFNRRSKVLQMTQQPGELQCQWIDSVMLAAREAEMAKLTLDELLAHIIVAGVKDVCARD